jgi:hypothetical protein
VIRRVFSSHCTQVSWPKSFADNTAMTPQGVYRCFESLLDLPLDKQAQCVRLAAEASVDVGRQHCQERGIEDLSPALFEVFDRWRNGQCQLPPPGDARRSASGARTAEIGGTFAEEIDSWLVELCFLS